MNTLALLLILTAPAATPPWQACESAAIAFGFDTGAMPLALDIALNCRDKITQRRLGPRERELILDWCETNPTAPCDQLLKAAGQ